LKRRKEREETWFIEERRETGRIKEMKDGRT